MRTALLFLVITFFIPQSFAQDNSTLVASLSKDAESTHQTNKKESISIGSFDLMDLDLELMYENTYDFVRSRYSYYKELELFNKDISEIKSLTDSVTFVGGILPFVSLAENEGSEGSSISNDGLSIFFFYKKQF